MEKQAANFEQIRRKRTAAKHLRRALFVLIAALLVVAGATVLKNMEYLNYATWFSDLYASMSGGPGFPQESPGSATLQMLTMGKDPVILTDTNLLVYNSSGKVLVNYQHGCRTPITRSGGGRLLTFDQGGKRLRVDSRSKNLFTTEFPLGIISANISQTGNIAVASASEGYQAEVRVYNSNFQELMAWYTSDHLIYDITLSADGNTMAALSTYTEGGEISSRILLLHISDESPYATLDIPGEVAVSAVFTQEHNLQVITDRAAYLYGSDGAQQQVKTFSGMHLLAFDNNPHGQLTVALDSYGDGNDLTLINIYNGFTEVHTWAASGPMLSLKNVEDHVLLLTETGLTVFNPDFSQYAEIESGDAFLCAGSKSDIYTISSGSIFKEQLPAFVTEQGGTTSGT